VHYKLTIIYRGIAESSHRILVTEVTLNRLLGLGRISEASIADAIIHDSSINGLR